MIIGQAVRAWHSRRIAVILAGMLMILICVGAEFRQYLRAVTRIECGVAVGWTVAATSAEGEVRPKNDHDRWRYGK